MDSCVDDVLLRFRRCLGRVPLREVEAFCVTLEESDSSGVFVEKTPLGRESLLYLVAEILEVDPGVLLAEMRDWVSDVRAIQNVKTEEAERRHQPGI